MRPGRTQSNWTDMSGYIVHLVQDTLGSAYANMIGVLSTRCLQARDQFGIARRRSPTLKPTVSFSEVPIDQLGRLARRRIRAGSGEWYGIGFAKDFMASRGAAPVFYAYPNSPPAQAALALMDQAEQADNPASAPIWDIAPFIDVPDNVNGRPNFFEWEREWRHLGDFHFHQDETAFLVMPETFHQSAAGFFADAEADNVGPAYRCPFVDIRWDRSRIQAALSHRT